MEDKIAILILAHHNPDQLTTLIEHLSENFIVYVQIDKKSTLLISELPKHDNVFYFKEVNVYWGDYSLVENMLFVLEKAFKNNHSHYLFISGDDFPIKPNKEIIDFLTVNNSNIYMYANPLPIKTWTFNNGFDRVDRYWYMKIKSRNTVKAINRILLYVQRIFGIKIKRFPIKLYAGSQWLNLTHEALKAVFNFLNSNPEYLKKLKYSRATDEMWIQTIIMNNSVLKEKVINNDLRYIDWETGPEFPRVLNENDEKLLLKSNALFARKFNFNRDKKFINSFLNKLNS
ncbi:beta-1,6-N-acetylglucosaminyltransferase [Flavivirga aquimarina]|uniref:Peptide O-xylosyltransferase n=1 Tax=Flavivirga aquimarina TaxID=2027862 RepID=A0ABT8WDC7_9FLAO|nr:beta-1,6-N-acetylglucosaminyltransferase [Flavivirga aquimarina]MDO5971133.1 beta-1,6-N-acetylglucosaminyltransferase [Flavivirga aquimarina]